MSFSFVVEVVMEVDGLSLFFNFDFVLERILEAEVLGVESEVI